MKICERCNTQIPEDFGNPLCLACYDIIVKEKETKKEEETQIKKEAGIPLPEELHQVEAQSHSPISDPNYKPNPPQEEIDMVKRNMALYLKHQIWLWKPTRSMYEFIRDSFIDIVKSHPQYPKFVWKPLVCDIGCGTGLGSNIISQEADFVWGIDKNPDSIKFATEMFARKKNNIYYTPEIRFDVIDIENPPPNVDMKFDVCVSVELWEHLENGDKLLQFIKHILYPTGIAWISSPNRQNKHLGKISPINKFHVVEYTSGEAIDIIKKYFNNVKLFTSNGTSIPEEEYLTTTHTPILYLCSGLKQ